MRTALFLALHVGLCATASLAQSAAPTTSATQPSGAVPLPLLYAPIPSASPAVPTGQIPAPGEGASFPAWSAAEPPGYSQNSPTGCADCVSGDLIEGEPVCANGYVDVFNGGCNSTPFVFGPRLECGQSVCGTYGTFLSSTGAGYRDTDWYQFTITVTSDVTFTATGTAATRVFILDGSCPAVSRATISAAACMPATVTIAALPAGTYYAFVGTEAFSGVPCGSSYRATFFATPCCEVAPQSGDVIENEPDCVTGYLDPFNGGCNSSPNVFSPISCGQTVAGRYGTFLSSAGANFRDTDWYQFTLTSTSDVTFSADGEAATTVLILNGACPAVLRASGTAAACGTATASLSALPAGTYYAFVATSAFSGVPCGSRYRATLVTTPCCPTSPQTGDTLENEPDCVNGYLDPFNGGCNSSPNVFSAIACGETVAGKYGTFLSSTGAATRDTDWYQFTLTAPADVTFTATGSAPTRVFIINGVCPAVSRGTATAPACSPATVTVAALPAGTYYAFVGTDVFTGVPCGSPYRATLTTTACCTVPAQPGDIAEGEILCNAAVLDSYNGGCNSSPQIYGQIACGQTIAGHYGTFIFGGQNYRDTDWYTLVIDRPASVRFTVLGEAATSLFLLNDLCPASTIASSGAAACASASITRNLTPGTYRVVVATTAFTGVPCYSRYRLTFDSSPCGCPADFNADGILDFFDYLDFVSAFSALSNTADFNDDGIVDFFDYLDFVQAFSEGCGA